MTTLFVSGVNDLSKIGVNLDEQGNPVCLMDGNASVHHRLPLKEGVAASFLIFGKGVRQRRESEVSCALRHGRRLVVRIQS